MLRRNYFFAELGGLILGQIRAWLAIINIIMTDNLEGQLRDSREEKRSHARHEIL